MKFDIVHQILYNQNIYNVTQLLRMTLKSSIILSVMLRMEFTIFTT